MSVGNQEHVSIGDVGFYVRTLPGIPTMAFTKSQQSYAFFALLFGGVFFVCVIVTQLESSPFPDGETTTGTVTGVETRGDGIVTKKKSTTLVEFVDSDTQHQVATNFHILTRRRWVT